MAKFLTALLCSVAIIAIAFFVSNQFPDQPLVKKFTKPLTETTVLKAEGEQISPTQIPIEHKSDPPPGIVALTYIAINPSTTNGEIIGCGDRAVSVFKNIPVNNTPLHTTYQILLLDHNKIYQQTNLYNALYQSNLQVQSATIQNNTAFIKLTGHLTQGGECDAPRIQAQLEDPARQFANVQQVQVFINNTPLSELLSGK